jgi:conjugative transfer region protein (TIGR03750 family)
MSGTFFDDDESAVAISVVAPLTDRVNSEPPILKGLSASEALYAAMVFFPLWLLVGGILGFAFGSWQVVMALTVIGPMVSVWVSAGYLAGLKRNRPDHYYVHAFALWRHRLGLGVAPFITRSGVWELGRPFETAAPNRKTARKTPRKTNATGA